jgi:hypothetical protein
MAGRIASDAFEFYLSLGDVRSYARVAAHYSVTKRAVAKRAAKENWQGRIQAHQAKAQEAVDRKAVETIEAMKERHLKVLKVIQSKALQALQAMPLDTAFQAVRALALSLEQERELRGEPGGGGTIDVEALIKNEYKTLILTQGAHEDWGDDGSAR